MLAVGAPLALAYPPPVNVSQTDGYYSVNPMMDFDSAGHVHLTYYDWAGTTIRLFYARPVEGVWQATQLGSFGASSGRMSGPFIVITPDDVIHIGYGIEHDIYEITKPVVGGAWSFPVRIDDMNGTETWINGFACDSSGGLYLVYMHLFDQDAGIYGRYKPFGGSWQPSELIKAAASDDNSRPIGARLTVHGDTLYVSYQWKNTRTGYYQRRLPGGQWESPVVVAGQAYGPVVAVSPDAAEMALLYFYDRGNCDLDFTVFAKFSTDGGATWSAEQSVSQNCWISRSVDAVYDAQNNLHVVYQQSDSNWDAFDVWMRTRAGGQWGSVRNLTDNAGRSGIASYAARTYDGGLYLTYSDNVIDGEYEEVFFVQIGSPIVITPAALDATAWVAEAVPNQTLFIASGSTSTITYTVEEDASWLSVSSSGGTVGGTPDEITVQYDTAGLAQGVHNATITVDAEDAYGTPVTIPVTLEILTVRPDLDSDNDVDMDDFGRLQRCMTGSAVPSTDPACGAALLDADADIDQDDLLVLVGCFSGADVPVDRDCDGGNEYNGPDPADASK